MFTLARSTKAEEGFYTSADIMKSCGLKNRSMFKYLLEKFEIVPDFFPSASPNPKRKTFKFTEEQAKTFLRLYEAHMTAKAFPEATPGPKPAMLSKAALRSMEARVNAVDNKIDQCLEDKENHAARLDKIEQAVRAIVKHIKSQTTKEPIDG